MIRWLLTLWWALCGRCRLCGGELYAADPLATYSRYLCRLCGWQAPEDDDEH
jgi:hypothetical protein